MPMNGDLLLAESLTSRIWLLSPTPAHTVAPSGSRESPRAGRGVLRGQTLFGSRPSAQAANCLGVARRRVPPRPILAFMEGGSIIT